MDEITDNGDIPVYIYCNLAALRVLHKVVDGAYKNWPGGDPSEQVELESIRNGLYALLLDTLLHNDIL
tara:strand:- start:23 stop:226 length:204 start_codon:yes stop_codon:yes gene_type:complete